MTNIQNCNFNIFVQNIRSLRANFDTFSLYIASLNSMPDLIFVTEIWIYSKECSEFCLPGYNFRACCNDSYRSGGVGVFIRNNIVNYSIQVYNRITADIISLDLDVAGKNWTFICIYRFNKGSVNGFCDDLESLLRKLTKNNVAILGDLNLNLLDIDESYGYQSMLASYGLISFLNEPTRMQSCLDHVFMKSEQIFGINIINLPIQFSDHNLIKVNISASILSAATVNCRTNISHVNYTKLNDLLKFEIWNSVYSQSNCNLAFENFVDILKSHIASSTFITDSPKTKKLKPWMNCKLLCKMNKLKKFSKKLKRYPFNKKLEKYVVNLSKQVKANVHTVKNLFYKNKFDSSINNSKATWKIVDEVLGRINQNKHITQIYQLRTDNTLHVLNVKKVI